jgi:hypothetical protein
MQSTAESLCRRIGAFDPLDDLVGRSYTASEFEELSPIQRAIALQRLVLFSRYDLNEMSFFYGDVILFFLSQFRRILRL